MKTINIQIFYWQQMSNTATNTSHPLVHLFWEQPIYINLILDAKFCLRDDKNAAFL